MYWTDSHGFIELSITKAQAHIGHQALRCAPAIKGQLSRLDPIKVREVLREFGAWTQVELSDHDANLDRLLWIACGDIVEGI